MRVLIHATCYSNRPSGALSRLVCLYRSIFISNPEVSFYITTSADGPDLKQFSYLANVAIIRTRFNSRDIISRTLWSIFYLPIFIKKRAINICDFQFLPFAPTLGCVRIGTIHDLRKIHESIGLKRLMYKFLINLSLRTVGKVITVSREVKAEICREFRLSEDKVVHVYNPLEREVSYWSVCPPSRPPQVRDGRKYFVSVGHLEARKNLGRLIEAFAVFLNQSRLDIDLVLVGNDSGEKNRLTQAAISLGISSRVIFTEAVTDCDRDKLVFHAAGAVYPSILEGFGIPIIEALSMGKYVAMSDIPVFREVGSTFAIYFDPFNVMDITDALFRLADQTPQQKLELGLYEHLEQFETSRSAARLSAVMFSNLRK